MAKGLSLQNGCKGKKKALSKCGVMFPIRKSEISFLLF